MRINWILTAAAVALIMTGTVEAHPGDRLRAWMAQRSSGQDAPAAPQGEAISYGADPLQKLDYWRAKGIPAAAPLVIFVHGGAWTKGSKDNATGHWKVTHYTEAGYAFASINYRLVPATTVEQQAQDVADAIKTLVSLANRLGIDRQRIVLMGHSAGAHLVALVGTDERYLRAAGLSFADIAGIIPIDGAAYDVPEQMKDGPQMMQRNYVTAFGNDPVRQRALSPTWQAAAPNAPRFFLPHVQRPDGVRQSLALVAALKSAGTNASEAGFPGLGLIGHLEINRRMGEPGYAPTEAVDAWLQGVFGG